MMTNLTEKELIIIAQSKLCTVSADAAKEQLYNNHINLIKSIANKYYNKYHGRYEFEDLVGFGRLGFMHALNKFDINQKVKLSTYAFSWINQAIDRGIKQLNGDIHVPHEVVVLNLKIENFKKEYREENGCNPTIEQISKALKISKKKALEAIKSCKDTVSIDTIIDKDGKATLSDLVKDNNDNAHEQLIKQSLKDTFINMVKMILTRNEYFVIKHTWELNNHDKYKQEQMAKILNLSVARIKQIKMCAMRKLKQRRDLFENLL